MTRHECPLPSIKGWLLLSKWECRCGRVWTVGPGGIWGRAIPEAEIGASR